jgi:hypothetical protein
MTIADANHADHHSAALPVSIIRTTPEIPLRFPGNLELLFSCWRQGPIAAASEVSVQLAAHCAAYQNDPNVVQATGRDWTFRGDVSGSLRHAPMFVNVAVAPTDMRALPASA